MSSADTPSPPQRRQSDANAPPGGIQKKKRVRNWTAEDRAAHRVLERSRREAFKERLTNLAALIPSLETTDPNRLSKHVVIDESIALHNHQRQHIEQLSAERDQLLAEIHRLRSHTENDRGQSLPGIQNPGDLRGMGNAVQNQPSLPNQPWARHQPHLGQAPLVDSALDPHPVMMPDFAHVDPSSSTQVPGDGMWDPTNMAMTDDALGALDMAPGQGADQIPIDPTVYHMGSDSMAHSSLSLAEPPMEAASTLLHYSGNYSS